MYQFTGKEPSESTLIRQLKNAKDKSMHWHDKNNENKVAYWNNKIWDIEDILHAISEARSRYEGY